MQFYFWVSAGWVCRLAGPVLCLGKKLRWVPGRGGRDAQKLPQGRCKQAACCCWYSCWFCCRFVNGAMASNECECVGWEIESQSQEGEVKSHVPYCGSKSEIFLYFHFMFIFLPRILSNTDEWSPQTIVDRILVDVEWTFEKLRWKPIADSHTLHHPN